MSFNSRALLALFAIALPFFAWSQPSTAVDKYLKALSSKNNAARFAAALTLDSITGDQQKEFKKLTAALYHRDPFVRRYVAYTVGMLQYQPSRSIPLLIAKFRDSDKKVRQYACVAVGMFGEKAIPFLLDSLRKNRGYLDEDAPTTWYLDDGERAKKIVTSGVKQDEEYLLTRTSFYALFCLRMLDAKKVSASAMASPGIPSLFKQVMVNDEQVEYEPKDTSLPDTTSINADVIDTLKLVKTLNDNIRGLSDTAHLYGVSQMLLEFPFLVGYYEGDLFALPFENETIVLAILANSGRYGLKYLPKLKRIYETSSSKDFAYLTMGYILTDNYGIYQPNDISPVNLYEFFFYARISDGFLYAEVNPFYIINKTGLTNKEKELMNIDPYFGDNLEIAMALEKLKETFIVAPQSDRRLPVNDSSLNVLVKKGLTEKSRRIQLMALQFALYLQHIDEPLRETIVRYQSSGDYQLQEAAADLGIAKKIHPETSAKIATTLLINRLIIQRFHEEQRELFAGEGTYGIGAWGAGPGGGTAKAASFWPPPPSTCRALIDITAIQKSGTLSDVRKRIVESLIVAGYQPDFMRMFEIKDGFAIMTKPEKTTRQGQKVNIKRWSKETTGTFASILSSGNIGYWRTLTFLVTTNANFQDNGSPFKNISLNEDLYNTGGFVLSPTLMEKPSKNYYLHVLVYHYFQKNGGVIRQLSNTENELSAFDHLKSLNLPTKF